MHHEYPEDGTKCVENNSPVLHWTYGVGYSSASDLLRSHSVAAVKADGTYVPGG